MVFVLKINYILKKYLLSLIVIFAVVIIGVFSFNFVKLQISNLFFKTSKPTKEIVLELQKKYQANVEINGDNGIMKGSLNKCEDGVIFNIVEPNIMSGAQVVYGNEGVVIKYQNLSSNVNDDFMLNQFPLSVILKIEDMVYSGQYDKCDIKNDILYVEGKKKKKKYIFKADLRRNRVISINAEDDKIVANYQL